ncbi:valyl-tRNA synthetase related protein [Thermoplasma acidophilum]|uniref:Valine--tRNA ligase n=1 Tax=Thermoplasma acidophilum (strain ATCC 25905 / DSM 1728 / JCM 9062 / NBRC 15155 / AMRC-C165) TaxID=273075 RepID=SYV_THEAC|nr:valine--tRNA ligase [Thermoplasma acidophilum]Q9HM29.1 RecName: Full=Valine--tRNA ligase; AltName: Full=Valyl-tRNA synthetase; Short=ValRS [Thermoplasma acidophilum DSM 1728]CAC11189.1 valyl-tRNA synthetase related protein [Thermoplasma acidophilum]
MDIDVNQMEEKWIRYWDEKDVYRFEPADRDKVFAIDTPPPTVSGKMHMGHSFSYPHIDFIARYKRMRGYHVFFPWGFDDNGLPTERYVEKETGIKPSDSNVEEFIRLCKEISESSEKSLLEGWKRIGMSCYFKDYYVTSSPESIRISQSMFLDLVRKGRVYRDLAPSIRCPTCKTSISQIEMKDQEMHTKLVYINFSVGDRPLTIATTRPEMLGSCVAVFVNPDDARYRDLIGKEATVPIFGNHVRIMADASVDMNFGTGAEMVCTFGDQNDLDLWKKYNLPLKISIDKDGRMTEEAGPLKGLSISDARKKIVEILREGGHVVKEESIKHSVNTHERCGTPIEIFIEKQWFIKYLDLKDAFIENGRKIEWTPEYMRVRYENWVNGLKWDWLISRQRYYGVPFPVWYCADCGNTVYADESELPVDPRIQKPSKKCDRCGSTNLVPERDVMDTWATSSLTPRIALTHFGLFDKYYPEDLRGQGHDIISFWAFTTIARSKIHDDRIPWFRIMISGNVYDMYGEKMSKSKGNIVDIYSMIDKYGADALRFWASTVSQGDDIRIKDQDFTRGRRTVIKMYNAKKLIDILKGDRKIRLFEDVKHPVNRWILTEDSRIMETITTHMDNYEVSKARTALDTFFWNVFCDNYLEMIKPIIQKASAAGDYDTVDETVYTASKVMLDVAKAYAPIMPFIAEEIYQTIDFPGRKISIHVDSWPDEKRRYSDANEEVSYIVSVIDAIRSAKSAAKVSVGTRVKVASVKGRKDLIEKYRDLLSGMLRIDSMEIADGDAVDATVFP